MSCVSVAEIEEQLQQKEEVLAQQEVVRKIKRAKEAEEIIKSNNRLNIPVKWTLGTKVFRSMSFALTRLSQR